MDVVYDLLIDYLRMMSVRGFFCVGNVLCYDRRRGDVMKATGIVIEIIAVASVFLLSQVLMYGVDTVPLGMDMGEDGKTVTRQDWMWEKKEVVEVQALSSEQEVAVLAMDQRLHNFFAWIISLPLFLVIGAGSRIFSKRYGTRALLSPKWQGVLDVVAIAFILALCIYVGLEYKELLEEADALWQQLKRAA